MTSLASRQPYPAALGSASMVPTATHYRVPPSATPAASGANHNLFTSPTESEFSESYRDNAAESVQDWDESRVGDWLKSIGCGQYVDVFRRNNINGENLMDMDQQMLKEMGIKKIGDRVRIGAQAKVFRNNVYKKASKKSINRVRTICRLENGRIILTISSILWQHSMATPNSHLRPRRHHAHYTRHANQDRH
jgi:mitogen-activated protein kinase kinase kinase